MKATLAAIVLVAALVGACGNNSSKSDTASKTSATSAPTTASSGDGYSVATDTSELTTTTAGAAPTGTAISIANFSFRPKAMKVPVGTKITVTNNDTTTHTWTDTAGHFDSGHLDPGAHYTFEFKDAGTFSYHCAIHNSMTGTVTVG